MDTAVHPKDTKPHYGQGPQVLSRRLNEANDKGYVAHETRGELQEGLHKLRQHCQTYKALAVAIADTTVPLLAVVQHASCRPDGLLPNCWGTCVMLGACSPRMPRTRMPPH